MWDYIVMGQIPGTSVQVTFETWLFFMAGLVLVLLSYKVVRTALQVTEDTTLVRPADSTPQTASTTRHIALAVKLLLAIRMRHIIETAAYSRWLITRQQIQA